MIKPCKFPQAVKFLPASSVDTSTGKRTDSPFHYYQDPQNKFAISCFELDDESIEEIKKSKQIFVVVPFKEFPPMTLQSANPFTPKLKINENGKEASPGHDDKPNKGSGQPAQD